MALGLGVAVMLMVLVGFGAVGVVAMAALLRRNAARADDRLRSRAPRVIAASLVMALYLWGAETFLSDALSAHGYRYWALAVLVLTGMAVYGIAGYALGAFRLSDFRSGIRSQR